MTANKITLALDVTDIELLAATLELKAAGHPRGAREPAEAKRCGEVAAELRRMVAAMPGEVRS